jgi:AraC-like DNA-binding protein
VSIVLKNRSESWLHNPLRSVIGELELAGFLCDAPAIDPENMRISIRYTLVLIVEGHGYFKDKLGTNVKVGPGDVILVFPGIAHAYGPKDATKWKQVYFVFDGPQFQLWRGQGLISPEHPVLRLGAVLYWMQRLQDVFKTESSGKPGEALRAIGRFLNVLADMIAEESDFYKQSVNDIWLEKSLRLLGSHGPTGWITPQEAAIKVGLNYENFRKRFVRLTHESPGRYQKRTRLEWACSAIYQGDYSLKQIADALGFCDVFHFSKAFKHEHGITPSSYRRKIRGL